MCIESVNRKHISVQTGITCTPEMTMFESGGFLYTVVLPATGGGLHIKVPFTVDIGNSTKVKIEHICHPNVLLDEPGDQEKQNVCLKRAGILSISG